MDGDPTDEVGFLVAGGVRRVGGGVWNDDVVGCIPVEAAGDVGELGREAVGFVGVDLPAQGGPEEKAVGCGGKERSAGELELHLAVDFDEGLGGPAAGDLTLGRVLVGGLGAGADDFSRNDLGALGGGDLEVDGFALVFLEEPVLIDDGGVVVLFEDVNGALAGRIAEDDGVGLEAAGDVGGGDFVEAGVEIEIDGGAGDGEVLVIDGEPPHGRRPVRGDPGERNGLGILLGEGEWCRQQSDED